MGGGGKIKGPLICTICQYGMIMRTSQHIKSYTRFYNIVNIIVICTIYSFLRATTMEQQLFENVYFIVIKLYNDTAIV